MSNQLSFLSIQNDLSHLQFSNIATANGDDIAGPDRRYHANAGYFEANFAEDAGHFCDQLTTYSRALLQGQTHGVVRNSSCCGRTAPGWWISCRRRAPGFRKRARSETRVCSKASSPSRMAVPLIQEQWDWSL